MSAGSVPSLRREMVVGFAVVLLVALTLFAGAAYLILRQSLQRTGTASLRQTALATEQLIAGPNIPPVSVREEFIPPPRGETGVVEVLRRRTQLATGQVLDIVVARTGDVEKHALTSFAAIAAVLIPITALVAAAVGLSLANRLLLPLNRLVAATREIGIGALSRRVEEPERPRELRELAQSFNGMLGRLERAVETLRAFTADASHELRTPLTAIRGTAEVALARERPADELRETLGEVLDETRGMLFLVEDLLTLARGDQAQAATPPREPVELAPLLRDVQELGEALAAGKPVAVELALPDEPLVVAGAAATLRRLFLNLVSNAVKFTDRGRVLVRARRVGPGSAAAAMAAMAGANGGAAWAGADRWAAIHPEGWVEVTVEDTGCGIPAEALPRVFDRFYRVDAARERSGGTGLGLAIARMIAEQHGGDIHAASTPGEGSAFTVRLPAAREEAAVVA